MTDDNLTKGQCRVLAHFLLEYRVLLDVEMITGFSLLSKLNRKPKIKIRHFIQEILSLIETPYLPMPIKTF